MRVLVLRFWRGESGQDLAEWALLIAFVTIGTVALMNHTGASMSPVWTATNVALQGQYSTPPTKKEHEHEHDR
jgi:Flp pilus assembly pilin Flp